MWVITQTNVAINLNHAISIWVDRPGGSIKCRAVGRSDDKPIAVLGSYSNENLLPVFTGLMNALNEEGTDVYKMPIECK